MQEISIYDEVKKMKALCAEQLTSMDKLDEARNREVFDTTNMRITDLRSEIMDSCRKIINYYETEMRLEEDKQRKDYEKELEGNYFKYSEWEYLKIYQLGYEHVDYNSKDLWFTDCLVDGVFVTMTRTEFYVTSGRRRMNIRYASLEPTTEEEYNKFSKEHCYEQ